MRTHVGLTDAGSGLQEARLEVRNLFAGIILSLLAWAPSSALAAQWSGYRNPEFGIRLSYPSSIFAFDRATSGGDGELYVSRDGRARLLIGAFRNNEHYTPRTYQRFISETSYPGAKIDYAPVGGNWAVLSGERDGTMFYEKVFFRCNRSVIGSFAMLYPTAERHLYDPIIERIENTFRVSSRACGS